MGVFHSLRLLLEAENPLAVQGVKKLVDPRYGGQYRQRSGDYRIFFAIEHGNVTFMKHTYKGTLTLVRVLRCDKAYD